MAIWRQNMRIDEIISVHEEIVVNENKSFIIQVLNTLKNMTWNKAQDFLRSKVKEFFNKLESSGVDRKKILSISNKYLWSDFRSVTPITNKKITENRIDEGIFSNWWNEATSNIYGALSFYPLLTAFLEMDKVIKQTGDADVRAMSIYFIVWIAIITGKVVSGKLVSKNIATKDDNKNKVKGSLHPAQVR